MGSYKVFLASSIVDFSCERNKLVFFLDKLSKALRAVDINTFICEQASKSLSTTRKQDDFNLEIRTSDLFLLLARNRIGGYTIEECRVALESSSAQGAPRIICYCQSPECQAILGEIAAQHHGSMDIREYRGLSALEADLAEFIAGVFPEESLQENESGMWVNGNRVLSGSKLTEVRKGH